MSQIAYVNAKGQLELIAADGSSEKTIGDKNHVYQFPAWSPDGKSIAAIGRKVRGASQGEGTVYIHDTEHGDIITRDLYSSNSEIPFYLYWSPDSRYISFLTTHPKAGMALYYLSANGGDSRLLHVGQPFFWVWHPDASEMLIHTGGAETDAELTFLKPPNSYDGLTLNLASPGYFQTPGISPSKRFVAFGTQDDSGKTDIVIEKKSTRKRKRFTHKGAAIMSWSPTNDYLAYISPFKEDQNFYGMLRLVEAESGRRIVLVEETVLAFFWSPDGRKIAYFTLLEPNKQTDPLSAFNNRRDQKTLVTDGYAKGKALPQEIDYALWLNLHVVDVFRGESRLLTPFKPNAVFVNQFMPFFDQYALSHRIWSPSSDAILIPAVWGEQERMVIVPINGLPPIDLAEGTMGFWSHG